MKIPRDNYYILLTLLVLTVAIIAALNFYDKQFKYAPLLLLLVAVVCAGVIVRYAKGDCYDKSIYVIGNILIGCGKCIMLPVVVSLITKSAGLPDNMLDTGI